MGWRETEVVTSHSSFGRMNSGIFHLLCMGLLLAISAIWGTVFEWTSQNGREPVVSTKVQQVDIVFAGFSERNETRRNEAFVTYLGSPERDQTRLRVRPYRKGDQVVGLQLTELPGDHPLRGLGLRQGDVLLEIDGEPFGGLSAFNELWTCLQVGKSIELVAHRGDSRLLLRLSTRESQESVNEEAAVSR